MKICELQNGSQEVEVTGTITELTDIRETKTKKQVRDATLKDSSGTIKLVLWNEDAERVMLGDIVKIENGYVSSYNNVVQLNIGKWGVMEITEAKKLAMPQTMTGIKDNIINGLLGFADQFENDAKTLRQMVEDLRKQ